MFYEIQRGKVFLELAKTDQVIGLHAALTKSRIEQINMNTNKLLLLSRLEAINSMRNEGKLKEFSRKKAVDILMPKNSDKVYNTAYINLNKGGQ